MRRNVALCEIENVAKPIVSSRRASEERASGPPKNATARKAIPQMGAIQHGHGRGKSSAVPCQCCSETISALEEKIAYYESELGLSQDATTQAAFYRLVKATMPYGDAAAGPVRVLMALHAAYPRTLRIEQLVDAADGKRTPDGPGHKIVHVYVSRLKKALTPVLGEGVIRNTRGEGYALSPTGHEALSRSLAADASPTPAMPNRISSGVALSASGQPILADTRQHRI